MTQGCGRKEKKREKENIESTKEMKKKAWQKRGMDVEVFLSRAASVNAERPSKFSFRFFFVFVPVGGRGEGSHIQNALKGNGFEISSFCFRSSLLSFILCSPPSLAGKERLRFTVVLASWNKEV